MTINNTNLTYDTRKKALRGGKKRAVSETDKEALETKFLWQHNQSQGFCFFSQDFIILLWINFKSTNNSTPLQANIV